MDEEKQAWVQLKKTGEEIYKQDWKRYNASKRYEKVSLYERFFGKPSSLDMWHRKKAEQDMITNGNTVNKLQQKWSNENKKWYGLHEKVQDILRNH